MNSIDLSHKQLTKIPEWVFSEKHTVSLDLSFNMLFDIDERILELENLKHDNS